MFFERKIWAIHNNAKKHPLLPGKLTINEELLLKDHEGIGRWPIEFKEKFGYRLVNLTLFQQTLLRKSENFVDKEVPYFPHLFILLMHYGTKSSILPCCLNLEKVTKGSK